MTEPQDVLAEALRETPDEYGMWDRRPSAEAILAALSARGYALVRTPETLDAPTLTEMLQADAERDRRLVREWDATLPPLPDSPSPTPPEGLHPHKPAIYGGYGVTCSCGAVLGWPSGWATTDEAARRVCLLHEYGLPESAIFDLVRLVSSPAPDPGAGLREALWQCGVESGMDTDGDTGPGALIAGMGDAGFAAAMVEHVRQLRLAYDECLAPSAEPPETEP